jgi:hypothetical protein
VKFTFVLPSNPPLRQAGFNEAGEAVFEDLTWYCDVDWPVLPRDRDTVLVERFYQLVERVMWRLESGECRILLSPGWEESLGAPPGNWYRKTGNAA